MLLTDHGCNFTGDIPCRHGEAGMKREKWLNPRVPMVTLGAKLAEEMGETVQEILNADEEGYVNSKTLKRIEEEAADAEFIASVIKSRAQEMRFRLMTNPKRRKAKV
jgi:NTP pyrophosphatase (non-canonical NTP hydrolase)